MTNSQLTRVSCCSVAFLLLIVGSVRGQQSTPVPERPADVPKAVLPFTTYIFDEVYRGEVISQIFVIRNEGTADLKVDITTGCSCEVATSDRLIPPGKEGRATVEVNTANAIGGAIKSATLHTNDPDRPSVALTLIANVLSNPDGSPLAGVTLRQGKYIGPLFVGPALRWKTEITAGDKARTEFNLSVSHGQVKILRIEGDKPHFASQLVTIEEGKKYNLQIETASSDAPGNYDAKLRVFTDNAMLQYFEIGLSVRVLPKK